MDATYPLAHPDHQDVVGLADLGRLQHFRHHRGLDQKALHRSAVADVEIEVEIGQRALMGGNECLARHGQHRIDNPDIGDVAGTYLTIDHFLARGRKAGHWRTPE